MRKFLMAIAIAAVVVLGIDAHAIAQTTATVSTSANAPSTTTVEVGGFLAQTIDWFKLAFGTAIASGVVAGIIKGLNYMGIATTDMMKNQLQAIVVNGINDGAAKAEEKAKTIKGLDVKSDALASAVQYTQMHGAQIITALGLDPKSGAAVEAINARIQTALNDPATPTPANITPVSGKA